MPRTLLFVAAWFGRFRDYGLSSGCVSIAVLHRTVDLIIEACQKLDDSVRHLAADDVVPLLSLCFNLSARVRNDVMGY